MAKTYRDIAIEEMPGTVEEAMSQAINCWGDLLAPMKKRSSIFASSLGKQLMPWSLLEGHSTDKCTKLTTGKALPRLSTEPTEVEWTMAIKFADANRAIERGNDEMAMFLAKAASRDMAHLFIGTAETGGNHELRKNLTPR